MSKSFKRLSSSQMRTVTDAAGRLNRDAREPFFAEVASQLKDRSERGDGPVGDAIRAALAKTKTGGT
jgi:hypothetical protein